MTAILFFILFLMIIVIIPLVGNLHDRVKALEKQVALLEFESQINAGQFK